MLKNYLKIAFRTLSKHTAHSLMNIVGLAVGMGCFILIFLFVQDELSYDDFHKNGERIYRIAGEYDQGGDTRNRSAQTTYLMRGWLEASFPDIKTVVRMDRGGGLIKHGDKMIQEDRLLFADEKFFEMFSFELLRGDPTTVLAGPNSMVITEAIAQKYFGESDPLGEVLEIFDLPIKITGVMKEMPLNSHCHGDFVISMKTVEPLYPNWVLTNATGYSHYTYVELEAGISPAAIEQKLADYMETKDKDFAESRTYFLQPVQEIHLYSNLSAEFEANGDMLYVYILSAVAFIILFMACINYMNLAVARSASRTKEVGIRKVVGANRRQLALQFLGESVVTAIFALLLAVLLVEVCLPLFNGLAGKSLQPNLTQNPSFMAGLLALALMIGVLAGSYPALFLSAIKSASILKGRFAKTGSPSLNLRRALVVVQFAASVFLLTSTLLIYNQLTFMRNKKLGINPEQVLVVPFQTSEIANSFEQIRNELLRNPEVLNVTATNNPLTARVSNWRQYEVEGHEEKVTIPTVIVTHDFFETLQGEIVAGRDFSRDFQTDVNDAYILNESAIKFLGLEEPIGTTIIGDIFTGSEWSKKNAKIIGVVKDFHFASLHQEIQPTAFSLFSEQTTPLGVMAIRISSNEMTSTLSFVQQSWQKVASARPMQYTFMDKDVRKLYQAEERFLQIFLAFAMLAISVTCLGVFGLSAYDAAKRTKEIGIRKVLGASVTSIIGLISSDFVKLVVLANFIAWPVAWLSMNRWLQDFAYRIDMSWWVFVLAGGLAILIALITVSTQAIRAALTNPVASLRYE